MLCMLPFFFLLLSKGNKQTFLSSVGGTEMKSVGSNTLCWKFFGATGDGDELIIIGAVLTVPS